MKIPIPSSCTLGRPGSGAELELLLGDDAVEVTGNGLQRKHLRDSIEDVGLCVLQSYLSPFFLCLHNNGHGEVSLLHSYSEKVFRLTVGLADISDEEVDQILVFPHSLDELSRIFPCFITEELVDLISTQIITVIARLVWLQDYSAVVEVPFYPG